MYTWLPLKSSADLQQLTTHLLPEYAPSQVAKKLVRGISNAVKGLLIERNYSDKDYRSTYYHFYSKKGQRYNVDCVRLHFFDSTVAFDDKSLKLTCADRLGDHYFGYMVLRPTGIATIGRSVLSPDVRSGATGYIIFTEHKVHLLGYDLRIEGFPSMDQHIDISVCAHAACWSILRHYSQRYKVYREFLTHDITLMAHQFDPGGLVPSKGLHVSHAERVFYEAGTFPVHVARRNSQDKSFYRQLGAYVEGGFPLFAAMHKIGHAVAVIGYQWRDPVKRTRSGMRYAWDEVRSLSVVDDNHLPYLTVPVKKGKPYSVSDIDAFIVALPEKVFYPADAVEKLVPMLFNFRKVVGIPPQNKMTIRYFITTGSSFRRFVRKRESELDPKLLDAIMKLPFAQFIWIVEFSTDEQWALGRIEARAVIDATASLREHTPLWLLHSRTRALVFKRSAVKDVSGMDAFKLRDMGHSGFSRMDQNLRPTRSK